ncbi:MAG: SGNH hydrolase domain-containing protein, partial [Solirubrobacteraceae bacterium]
RPLGRSGELYPCAFGGPADAAARRAIALIGDSHAAHWRAAVGVVAAARGWTATSLTRSSCPFSRARVIIASDPAACRRWNRQVVAWLTRHREVSTIFLSARANARYVRTRRSRSNFETAVEGHLALWRALPETVRSIIVLRDTPLDSSRAQDCVRRAYARRQPGGVACARERRVALPRDPAVSAARRIGGRVHVLDMTHYFCGSARCYPIVGGALVHKDADHITATYAKTLGPFMLPAVDDLVL